MSRKERKMVAGAIAIAIIAIISLFNVIHDVKIDNFINNAEIVEVSVGNGNGLDYYCYQVKPDFIEIDEYRHLIMEENNLPQSGEIYSGQVIKLYK